ncbi:hypothetical protein Gpo141_00008775 [Globisporangium polare]
MSSWDGRCKRCHRLMSICKCFVSGGGGGDQNSNPNGFSSGRNGGTPPMQLAHGKRHLFETLKGQHPLRSHGLVSIHGEHDADKRTHHNHHHHSTQQQRVSSARSRADTRSSSVHRTPGRPPSSSGITSSSVPAIPSHISRPSTTTAHRHSSPVPPRDSTGIPTLPTSRSDPAAIRQYQTTQSSSRMSSSRYAPPPPEDPSQYYVDYSVPLEESDPAIYEL